MSDAHGEDDLKYVGIVAVIIGGTVLVLGLLGVGMTFI